MSRSGRQKRPLEGRNSSLLQLTTDLEPPKAKRSRAPTTAQHPDPGAAKLSCDAATGSKAEASLPSHAAKENVQLSAAQVAPGTSADECINAIVFTVEASAPSGRASPKKSRSTQAQKSQTGQNGRKAQGKQKEASKAVAKIRSDSSKGSNQEVPSFSSDEVQQVWERLLSWYDREHRVLPWRRNQHSKLDQQQQQGEPAGAEGAQGTGDVKAAPAELPAQGFAYYVWVSEIMLQQTQVATVISYFNRWIERWPSLAALASATQEEVNQLWSGLGYYRRARYLLEGAQYIQDKLGGKFPEAASQLRQIPGVGPYTSAAIASIAFNDSAAAVDGNVIRVLSRLRCLKDPKPSKLHDSLAAALLDPDRPGCHNQAMMELGATVCKPVNPDCSSCPVSGACQAYAAWQKYLKEDGGDPEAADAPRVTLYPGKAVKPKKKDQHVAVCVLKVLLRQPTCTAAAATTADAEGAGKGIAGPAVAAAAAAGSVVDKGNGSTATAATCKPAKGTKGKQQYTPSIRGFFKPVRTQQQQLGKSGGKGDNVSGQQQQQEGSSGSKGGGGYNQQEQRQQRQQVEEGFGLEESKLTEVQWRAQGVKVYYLLTQRPEGGLLAGLWEFPSVVLGEGEGDDGEGADESLEAPAAAGRGGEGKGQGKGSGGGEKKVKEEQKQGVVYSNAVCREAVDQYMKGELEVLVSRREAAVGTGAAGGGKKRSGGNSSGSCSKGSAGPSEDVVLGGLGGAGGGGDVQLVDRCHLGNVVHIFSHIHQVNHVEQLVLVADSLEAVCPAAVEATAPAEAAAAAAAAIAAAAAGNGGSGRRGAVPRVMCWVPQEALKGFGLTAGVRKALGLVQKGS